MRQKKFEIEKLKNLKNKSVLEIVEDLIIKHRNLKNVVV